METIEELLHLPTTISEEFSDFLSKHEDRIHLEINFELTSEEVLLLCHFIETNQTAISYSFVGIDLNYSDFSMIIDNLIKNRHLSRLSFVEIDIGFKVDKIVDLIFESTLQSCTFDDNNLDTAGTHEILSALELNPKLEALAITNNNIRLQELSILLSVIDKNTTLSDLAIGGDNAWGIQGASMLASMIKNNTTLTTLKLHRGGFEKTGIAQIASALKTNTTLNYINLAENKIDDESLNEILSALEVNTSIEAINLAFNDITAGQECNLASFLSRCTTIKSLYLHSNYIDTDEVIHLAQALRVNTCLEVLDISRNRFNSLGAFAVAQCLVQNQCLTSLDIAPLSGEWPQFVYLQFEFALVSNFSLTELCLTSEEHFNSKLYNLLKLNYNYQTFNFWSTEWSENFSTFHWLRDKIELFLLILRHFSVPKDLQITLVRRYLFLFMHLATTKRKIDMFQDSDQNMLLLNNKAG